LRICFLSLQMNATEGFFARLNGVQRGHPAKMTICQQEAPSLGLTGSGLNNESARPKPRAVFYDCNIVGVPRYRLSLLACVRPCLLQALFIRFARPDICPSLLTVRLVILTASAGENVSPAR